MAVLPRCTHRHRLLFAIAALSIAIVHSNCAAETNTLSPQARRDFQWFSTLGFPDLKGCPYVRVSNGQWNFGGNEPLGRNFAYGFLLATNATGFTLYNSYMSEVTFNQPNPGSEKTAAGGLPARPAYEVVGLSNGVKELFEVFRTPTVGEDKRQLFGSLLYDAADVFTLAWACWRNGLDAEAAQLYEQSAKMGFRWGQDETTSNFSLALEKDLGEVMFARAVGKFEDPAISRAQLLAQFESVISNYPHSPEYLRANHFALALKRMVSEDEDHAKLGLTNLTELPVEQQVRELIFRLRDQNAVQFSFPSSLDIFENTQLGTNSPAHQLLRLGYAAVPQLIEALNDPTFCRMVDSEMPKFVVSNLPESTVLTVGDCAVAILGRIAATNFYWPSHETSHFSAEGDVPATRKAVQSWWAEAGAKGEKQMLMDSIGSPGFDAVAQAETLRQRYPDVAAAAIIHAVQAASDSYVRSRLVDEISKLDDPQVTAFLSHYTLSASSLEERVAAASGLLSRRKDEAVQAMIHEWDNLPGKNSDDPHGYLVGFLAGSDSAAAIQALARDLRRRPAETRSWVISCVGGQLRTPVLDTNGLSPAMLNAIEECLVAALDDSGDSGGISAHGRVLTVSDPRISDMAGSFLSEKWPERYVFDVSLGARSRNRQRVECQNVWRLAHNLPALPLPPLPPRLKPDQANRVTAIEWTEDSAKPSPGFAARVDAFQNKLLDTNSLVAFLAALGTHPEPDFSGIKFKAVKDRDLTGVRFTIRLLPGTPPPQGQGWSFGRGVTVGGKALEGTAGGDTAGKYSSAAAGNFPTAVAKALAAEPETSFEINFRLGNQ
jgi:hypothetical protein